MSSRLPTARQSTVLSRRKEQRMNSWRREDIASSGRRSRKCSRRRQGRIDAIFAGECKKSRGEDCKEGNIYPKSNCERSSGSRRWVCASICFDQFFWFTKGKKKKNRRRKVGRQDVRFKEIRKMRCGHLFLEFQTKRAGGVKILWGWMSEWMKKKNSNEKISWLMNGSKRASKRKSEDEVTDGTRGRNFLFSLKVFKIPFRLNRDDQLCQRIRT